jgi:phosphatidylglycerophosphate synthase
MLANKFRSLYNAFVVPLGNASINLGITADTWTLLSLFASIIGGAFIALGEFWWGLALIIVMLVFDILDGATARASGRANYFGKIFDHVIDRYAEFFVVGGMAVGGWISPFIAMFISSGMVMASYVRAKAESTGAVSDCAVGIMGRVEKLLLIYLAVVFLGLELPNLAGTALVVVGILSHITAIQRLLFAKAKIK